MRLRSIQLKIALLAGVCVVAASSALVSFSIVSAGNSKAYVGERLDTLLEDDTRDHLQALALAQAALIGSPLNSAFDSARNIARVFEVAAARGDKATIPAGARRAELNAILLNVLKDNPRFNGTYSAWEPNALDGQDALFRDRADVGSDATGRFLPYWTRSTDGNLAVQPLVEYDSSALHPNGVMKGGWYLGPKAGGGESILDPLPYIVQGKSVYLATMSVPITIDNAFVGVAGADFDLTFVQKLAEEVKASIYGGQASVQIISHKGLIVASSEHPDAIGRPFDQVEPAAASFLPVIQSGQEAVEADAESFTALSPIVIGRTATPWSVLIEVPRSVALAEGAALESSLTERNASGMVQQVIVGLVIAAGGIIAMWFVARTIASPITRMTGAMERLARSDVSIEVPGLDRIDEIGAMAAAVSVFRENAIQKTTMEEDSARDRVEREAQKAKESAESQFVVDALATGLQRLADGDVAYRITTPFAAHLDTLRTDFNMSLSKLHETLQAVMENARGIDGGASEIRSAADDLAKRTEEQAASVEQTAATLQEITKTMQDSTRRAEEAGVLVSRTRLGAEKAGDVVRTAVQAMQQIEKSSSDISNIIGVIDEIAFQTNLLALNAGVEAARAGDAGKGFAVVAHEVRELAQRSANAAKEIKALINASGEQVHIGAALVGDTGRSLETIVGEVQQINSHVNAIVESAREQSVGIQEINTAVGSIDRGTQQNAAMVEESTAASHSLAGEAQALSSLISQFNLGKGAGPSETSPPIRLAAHNPRHGASSARPSVRKTANASGASSAAEKSWNEF